ncbi:MAG: hypothetical protein WD063_09610 [Pirellulales bacterium]
MHVIRLRGPWELEPLVRYVDAGGGHREETADLPHGGKTRVPGDWAELLGADFLGRVRYTRRFNCPTNLDAHQRVWLVLEGVDHDAELLLNNQPLGPMRGCAAKRFDITPLLISHNELWIDVSLAADAFHDAEARGERAGHAGGLVGEVRLEIGRVAAT